VNALNSALYIGRVIHRRVRPKRHLLRYRTWCLLLDLDELRSLSQSLWLYSHNSPNLFSTRDSDYGAGVATSLREQVEAHMRSAGMTPDGGAIRLLTMPRILGYAFNPISVYYCYSRTGALIAMLYEVNNTFGQRHSYFFPVDAMADGWVRQSCAKKLYVSPFMTMEMTYDFLVSPPGDDLSLRIVDRDADGVVMTALQQQRRVELNDVALLKVFCTHPLLTLKVTAGIHLEALLLWLKGVPLQERPLAPHNSITLGAETREKEQARS
jgi:uncharacterized protein